MTVSDAVRALTDLSCAVSAAEFPADRLAATRPGLYSWWADATAIDLLGGVLGSPLSGPIYVGQAGATRWPSGTPSSASLGSRIRSQHIGGNVSSSTFRLTISSILRAPLGLDLLGPGRLTPDANAAVTEWIRRHLLIAIHPYDDRATLAAFERAVVEHIDPPLNLDHCADSPTRLRLRQLRAAIAR